MQFFGVKQSKIQWTDLEIKFIKHENNLSKMEAQIQKVGIKNLEKIIKIEKKICNFFGINESKIRWTDLEIKFIKHKNNLSKMEAQIQKVGIKNLEKIIKIEKKICNFLV